MRIENGLPVLTDTQRELRCEEICGLRQLADFLEAHPHIPPPFVGMELVYYPESKEELAALVRAIGSVEKYGSKEDSFLRVRKRFEGGVVIRIAADKRRTCERIKIGERVVPAQPERVMPATEARVEPIFGWQCDEPILATERNGAPAAT